MDWKNLKGHPFVRIETKTQVKLNKKSRTDKSPCPLNELYKFSSSVVGIGGEYINQVNRRRVAEGLERIEPEKPKGKHWIKYPYILASDNNPEQKYLRTYYYKTSKPKLQYLNSKGKPVEISTQFKKDFFPVTSKNEFHDNPLIVRDYKLENVISIKGVQQ